MKTASPGLALGGGGRPSEQVVAVASGCTGWASSAGGRDPVQDRCPPASVAERRRVARALAHGGQYAAAVTAFREVVEAAEGDPDGYDDDQRRRDLHGLGVSEMHRVANEHLGRAGTQAADPVEGFVVVYNAGHPVATGLVVPLVAPLHARGYAVQAVTAGTLRTPRTACASSTGCAGAWPPTAGAWSAHRTPAWPTTGTSTRRRASSRPTGSTTTSTSRSGWRSGPAATGSTSPPTPRPRASSTPSCSRPTSP